MRLSTIHTKTLIQINQLTSLQPLDPSDLYSQNFSHIQPLGHEPTIDDVLMTNNTFSSEKNDIKPVFTGSKFLSLTEDLLHSHMKLCIHKNNSEEFETLDSENLKQESTREELNAPKEEEPKVLKISPPKDKEKEFREYKKAKVVAKERKSIGKLMKQALLDNYLTMVDPDQIFDEFYTIRGCDLETKLEEMLPFLKLGHRRRLGVIILEERGEFKRQGMLKFTENALFVKELNGEEETDAKEEKKKNAKLPSLDDWLNSMKMLKYLENFVNIGYDNYEFLLLMMCSEHFMLNDMRIKNDIKIEQYEDRNEILTRLYKDRYNVINIDTGIRIGNNGPELEGTRETAGCKTCSIF